MGRLALSGTGCQQLILIDKHRRPLHKYPPKIMALVAVTNVDVLNNVRHSSPLHKFGVTYATDIMLRFASSSLLTCLSLLCICPQHGHTTTRHKSSTPTNERCCFRATARTVHCGKSFVPIHMSSRTVWRSYMLTMSVV